MMKLQFLACALATCLVAADISQLQLPRAALSGADVGAVEKEVANQTPQPAAPAPSPTEKENRAVPAEGNRAVPAPSPAKENRAVPAESPAKENRAVPAESPAKENRAAVAEKENLHNTTGSLADTSSIDGATAAAVASEKLKSNMGAPNRHGKGGGIPFRRNYWP